MPARRLLGNWPNAALALIPALALGGCSLAPFDEDGLFRRTTTAAGLTGKLAEPAPFVKESRPEQIDYKPVGVTPTRPTDALAPAGVAALEQQLRARQAQSLQQAAAPVPPSPYAGKIEPGFKPPQPPPLPEGKAPDLGLRGVQTPAAPGPAGSAANRTNNKNTPTRKKTQEGADSH